MNERKTEGIVRKKFDENKIIFPAVKVEEQKSDVPKINRLLRNASKSGNGCGKPEFIVSFPDEPNLLIIVECKPNITKHASENLDKYDEFAVDGALLYSSFLSKEYDVFSIAITGENQEEAIVSTFLQLNGASSKNLNVPKLLGFEDYLALYRKDPEKEKIAIDELIKYSKKLNNQLRDEFELEEGQRPLLVSGILIALEDKAFASSYLKEKRAIDLAKSLTGTISKILEQHQVDQKKRADMINVYSFIETNNNIAEDLNEERNTKLRDLITEINGKVRAFMKDYKYHDVLGQFYGEFLRYANGDEGLGIVLTPREVTELFVELANVDKDSVVLDNCCGTAGFLISSMKRMSAQVPGDSAKIRDIHDKQLIGIENNDKMFCLACSNMLLRGDGKSNIFYNTCFGINKSLIRNLKPTIGFLNPPYSKKKEGSEELNYVLNCIEFLEKNAICIAIVPMRCAIKNSVLKQELLRKHTLEAVMSMPDDLFYPLGTITCIMVLKAHVPHNKEVDTWFGYWKDDGLVKSKYDGRLDKHNKWNEIRKFWLDDFRNKREIAGRCVRQKVTFNDEWCAEAYMKTDYSILKRSDFEEELKKFILHKLGVWVNENSLSSFQEIDKPLCNSTKELNVGSWKEFAYNELFNVEKGKRVIVDEIMERTGKYNFVSAIDYNNGVFCKTNLAPNQKSNVITVNYDGNGVAETYYQDQPFWALDSVNILYPKFSLNPLLAMFLVTLIRKEKYRFNYGRKWHKERMEKSTISLPIDNQGKPDWQFMEEFIRCLPYSKALENPLKY